MENRTPKCLRPLTGVIHQIREYTQKNDELIEAHHFLYALPLSVGADADRVDFVVMGVNPGNSRETDTLSPGCGHEETFLDDFQERAPKRAAGSKRWFTSIRSMLGNSSVVLTEAFFWSSYNFAELEQRYGKFLGNPHLVFCHGANVALFNAVNPRAIVLPGLLMLDKLEKLYGLSRIQTIRCDVTGHRLVECCHDGKRPWLFTKHWSGGRGFTGAQKGRIKQCLENV